MSRAFKILPKNYLEDWGEFESWAEGTLPSGWLVATAGTYAQESTEKKYGNYAAKIVGSCVSGLYRTIPNGSDYYGKTFTYGMWVKSSGLTSHIKLSDGVSVSTAVVTSTAWQELKITKKLDYSATELRVDVLAGIGTTAYFDSGYLCEGEDAFTDFDTNIDIAEWQPTLNIKQDEFEIARREGSYIPQFNLRNETIAVKGNVVGTDVVSCRTHFDNFLKSLLSWKKTEKRNLYLYEDRVLDVFLRSFNWGYVNSLMMIKYNLQLSVPAATSRGLGKLRHRQVISGTITEFNFSYNGNAESRPQITFIADQAATISTCSLENLTTGQSLAYAGTVPTNSTLDIDCNDATVFSNAIDRVGDFTGDFLSVVRGTNYFRFSGSNCTIRIDYFERWF